MAAAILAHLAGPRLAVTSAGVRAGDPDPFAIAVMDEIGIDMCDHEPQMLGAVRHMLFDRIVTLSPEAHHHALEFTRIMAANVTYWPTEDATAYAFLARETRERRLGHYRHVRDQLFSRIKASFMPDGTGGPTV